MSVDLIPTPMKLELNDQQKMIQKMVREFAKKEIAPVAAELDKKEESIENFRKGVKAFRRDNFPHNALALSKKILRHKTDGFDMYYTIADLLVELDVLSRRRICCFDLGRLQLVL